MPGANRPMRTMTVKPRDTFFRITIAMTSPIDVGNSNCNDILPGFRRCSSWEGFSRCTWVKHRAELVQGHQRSSADQLVTKRAVRFCLYDGRGAAAPRFGQALPLQVIVDQPDDRAFVALHVVSPQFLSPTPGGVSAGLRCIWTQPPLLRRNNYGGRRPGSGENGGSRCERGPPVEIPPNGLRREPLRMYFYTRADIQASALELLSKITSCSSVLATFSIHTAPRVSRRPSVVVMQAIEDWECHDTTVSLGHSRQRLFLPEALVWPRLVVEAGVLRDEAQKMALATCISRWSCKSPSCCSPPRVPVHPEGDGGLASVVGKHFRVSGRGEPVERTPS